MNRRRPWALALAGVALAVAVAQSQRTYTTLEAGDHIGETAAVCGNVTGTQRSAHGNVFMNLDRQYPNQAFTVYVPSASADAVGNVSSFDGEDICVTGKIALDDHKPEIVVTRKDQISRQK